MNLEYRRLHFDYFYQHQDTFILYSYPNLIHQIYLPIHLIIIIFIFTYIHFINSIIMVTLY